MKPTEAFFIVADDVMWRRKCKGRVALSAQRSSKEKREKKEKLKVQKKIRNLGCGGGKPLFTKQTKNRKKNFFFRSADTRGVSSTRALFFFVLW